MTALWAALGLRRKILLLVTVGLLAVFGILGQLSYQAIQDLRQLVVGERLTIAQMVAADIDQALGHSQAELEELAHFLGLSWALTEDVRTQAEAQSAFNHFFAQHPWVVTRPLSLRLYDASGLLLSSYGAAFEAPELAAAHGAIVSDVLQGGEGARKEFAHPRMAQAPAAGPLIVVAVPVTNRNQQVVGALALDLELFPPSQDSGPTPLRSLDRYAVRLVDAQGVTLAELGAGSYPRQEGVPSQPRNALMATPQARAIALDRPGEPQPRFQIAASAPLKSFPWGIVVTREEDTAAVLPTQLRTQFLLFGGMALGIALLVAWVTTGWVLRPIHSLVGAFGRIAGGHLDDPLVVSGRDETAALAQAFEEMRTQLRASQAAIEERNRILEERVQRRTQELAALYEVSQVLASSREPESLGDAFLAKTQALFPQADAGVLFLYAPEEGTLRVRASFGVSGAFAQEGQGMPPDFCSWQAPISGQAFYTGQARLCGLPELPPGVLRAFALQDPAPRGAQGKRGMCVPLVYGGRSIGSLMLYQFHHAQAFTQEDLELLQALANQAALAIENARLVQEAGKVQALQELDRIKTEFVARASHELRTPLTSIKSLAETLLRRDIALGEVVRHDFLEGINRAADRLANIITDLLTVSRIESGKLEVRPQGLDLVRIVERVVSQFRQQDPTHSFEILALGGLSPVWADPDKVEDVLNNLISNAVKYAPAQTTITVALQLQERAPSADTAATQESGQSLLVSVRDRGPGIPRSEFGKLFQRFSRVDSPASRAVGGVGLGLYICRAYVEAMGSTIWAESAPGEGATFCFTLPLAQEESLEPQHMPPIVEPVAPRPDAPFLEGMCLLVVDDEPDVRRIVRLHLEAVGCQVLCAPTAERAAKLLQRYHPDAIILDVVLPGCSGFELAERLQAQASTRGIPVVFLTAKAQEEDERRARELGAYAFLKKPFSTEHLHQVLAQLCAQQRRTSSVPSPLSARR